MSTAPHAVIPSRRRRTSWRPASLIAVTLLLAACSKQELYSQLTERQANEMVAALRSADIDAEKQSQEGRFSVLTASGDFSRAVQVLNAQGLPRETFDTMGKVFKREGFVSSPLEEHARLLHAMSQEISNTLANIDGVVTARVHLVVPARNPLADQPQPAAASVFIKHRPDRELSAQVAQIKALVVNSVEGLAYDNVTVALFPADAMPGGSGGAARPAAQASAAFASPLETPLLSASLAGALALGGGALLWWRRRGHAGAAADTSGVPALMAQGPGPHVAAMPEARASRLHRKA
jgi:type III secretion protein J